MTASVDAVIARFESQLGVTESPMGTNRVPYNDWYGIRPSPWCATFVSWAFFHEGLALPASTSKGFAYTPSGAAWFRNRGRWTTRPARGNVVFFDFPGDGVDRISHVGVVTGVNADGSIDTIEGNTDERGGRTGGKVMRRRRAVGIVGYGIPPYAPAPASTPLPATPWKWSTHMPGPLEFTSAAACPTGGYWRQTAEGGIHAFDGAPHLGAYNQHPNLGGNVRYFPALIATTTGGYIQLANDTANYRWDPK